MFPNRIGRAQPCNYKKPGLGMKAVIRFTARCGFVALPWCSEYSCVTERTIGALLAAYWNIAWPLAFSRPAIGSREEDIMFSWAIAFLISALIAGALGFGVVAGTAFAAAKIVFIVALVAFLISAVLGFTRRGVP